MSLTLASSTQHGANDAGVLWSLLKAPGIGP